ncbi:right-handed parallel beta-helix repeat-containing protein [uncultured Kriegella sp.]|uniref:right-handed parallel beta-helix repeat-containing protein n=1 Tax=uncultured Kriegella sp. TaxID=1798910 RepID=UPI0030D87E41|tara:strand:+ start:48336 stop:50504 length:2169 start_codon:yes stop_codon:yes gene_type:complete
MKLSIPKVQVILVLFVVLANFKLSGQSAEHEGVSFYIFSNGDDSNPGTKEQPLASLIGARNAISEYRDAHSTPTSFTIWIGDGRYEMKEPFVLLPEDGGESAEYPVVYKALPNAAPLFSGGKKISGLRMGEDGVWETRLSEFAYYGSRFDQLYVNGKRAVLARTPNEDFLEIGGVEQHIWEQGSERMAERAQQVLTFKGKNADAVMNIEDGDMDLVRFRAFHKWDFTLRHLDKIDKDSSRIYTSGRGMKSWNPLVEGGRMVLENYRKALDAPGEWFLDKNSTLYYKPREGETLENVEIVVPVLENLVTVSGNATANDLVKHIRFEGLRFAHCNYRFPRTGSEPNQAGVAIDAAAIMLEGASDITFADCEISHTGQHAIWFGKGCSNSLVEHCYLNDLGGGGIYIGIFDRTKSGTGGPDHTHHIRVHNNILQGGSREFPSAVGVWIGHGSDNEITHNDIGDFYYSGVSVGWTWGYKPSTAKRNTITYNRIHHIGWALLSDMGGVYTLGKSEGTVVSHNIVHDINSYTYGGWGLYTDEGSSDIVMENNLVYNTKTGGFHQHYGENNSIRNNIFAYAKKVQMKCTRVEEHKSFDFTNNIILFDKGTVLEGNCTKLNMFMDNNLFWNTSGDEYDFEGLSFQQWQKKTGHDSRSIIADPHFKDPKSYNFTLQKNKNVRRIKFKPFDYGKAGVYGDSQWKEKAKLSSDRVKAFDIEVERNNKNKQLRY